jgi:hypothetical protein
MGDCFNFLDGGLCKDGGVCPWNESEGDRKTLCAGYQDEDHVDEVL